MKTNEKRENSKLLIYSILLSQKENILRRIFTSYPNREQGIDHMNEIARLGGTKKLLEAQSPEEINNAFQSIANAISPKYGLKIIQNI